MCDTPTPTKLGSVSISIVVRFCALAFAPRPAGSSLSTFTTLISCRLVRCTRVPAYEHDTKGRLASTPKMSPVSVATASTCPSAVQPALVVTRLLGSSITSVTMSLKSELYTSRSLITLPPTAASVPMAGQKAMCSRRSLK